MEIILHELEKVKVFATNNYYWDCPKCGAVNTITDTFKNHEVVVFCDGEDCDAKFLPTK